MIKKIIFFFFLGSLINLKALPCQSADKVVLFFDFNESRNELSTAKKQAESTCKKFESISNRNEAYRILSKYEKSHLVVESVILSGHSGDMGFSGTNFKMNKNELMELFEKHPKIKSNIDSLYLWGCYTNNIEKLDKWLKTFNNLEFVFGFDMLSPLDEQMTGVSYLKQSLDYRDSLKEQKTLNDIKEMLDTFVIPGSQGFHYVNAAIYGQYCQHGNEKNEFYYVIKNTYDGTKSSINDYTKFKNECNSHLDKYTKEYQGHLLSYWVGAKKILDLKDPRSKDPAIYPLRREIYPWVNQNAHCFKKGFELNNEWIGVGEILNLIYFNVIRDNFFSFFNKDLQSISSILLKTNSTYAHLKLFEKKDFSRLDAIAVGGILNAISADLHSYQNLNKKEKETFINFNHRFQNYLVSLDSNCADIEWIKENAKLSSQSDSCMHP